MASAAQLRLIDELCGEITDEGGDYEDVLAGVQPEALTVDEASATIEELLDMKRSLR